MKNKNNVVDSLYEIVYKLSYEPPLICVQVVTLEGSFMNLSFVKAEGASHQDFEKEAENYEGGFEFEW